MIAKWYKARGQRVPEPKSLSTIGFIADDRVAAWLYVTNSNMAMIECVISNPDTVPSLRRESLQHLCSFMVDAAMAMGYTNLAGITNHPSIEAICSRLGFKKGPASFGIWVLSEK